MPASSKAGRKTRVVVLALSREALSQFPAGSSGASESDSKRSDGSTPSVTQPDALDDRSESNATPVPPAGATTSQAQDVKKMKPMGRKRAPPAIDPDAPARERARPGPKKRQKLDGNADTSDAAKTATPNAAGGVPAHKLGPKANTGAINAGLRALDRSGKPCRRWEKKGLQLKSFTGTVWGIHSWTGSSRPGLSADGEVQSDSSSEVKPDASALASEKSTSGDVADVAMGRGIESSPAPPIAVS